MKPSPVPEAELARNAERWRDAFIETVRPWSRSPLMLSGGIDSATILAALLAIDARPTCYTYRIDSRVSPDVASARRITAAYHLDLVELQVRSDQIERDAREAIRLLKVTGRVSVQCGIVCLKVMRQVRADGHHSVLNGVAGVVWDTRQIAVMVGARAPREEVDALRRKGLYQITPGGGTDVFYRAAAEAGLDLLDPYQVDPLASVGLSIPVPEVNWPRPKELAVRAFPEFYARGWYRRPSPMQVNSGLRELHDETILSSAVMNPGGAKMVAAVYRRWAREDGGLWAQEDETDE